MKAVAMHLCALSAFAACGPRVESVPAAGFHANGVPSWLSQGSGFDEEKRTIVAVESSGGRARDEIIELLEHYTALWLKAYAVATYGGDFAIRDDGGVEAAVKRIAVELLQNVETVERWTHPEGTVHLLMRLDLSDVPARAGAYGTLDPGARARLETSAEVAFDQLAAALGD